MKKLLCSLLSLSLLPVLAMESVPDKATEASQEISEETYAVVVEQASKMIMAFKWAPQENTDSPSQNWHQLSDPACLENTVIYRNFLARFNYQKGIGFFRLDKKSWYSHADFSNGGFSMGNMNLHFNRIPIRTIAQILQGANETRNSGCVNLVAIKSSFFQFPSYQKLQDSQRRTWARISVFKKMRPALPRDIQALILSMDKKMWQDACNTPLALHVGRHTHTPKMPLQMLRTFIKGHAFNGEKIIEIITTNRINKLKQYREEIKEHQKDLKQKDFKKTYSLITSHDTDENYRELIRRYVEYCLTAPDAEIKHVLDEFEITDSSESEESSEESENSGTCIIC